MGHTSPSRSNGVARVTTQLPRTAVADSAAAPSKVPAARYNALELVGPRNGLETMYTVAIAQYGRGICMSMAMYSAIIEAANVRTP